MLSEDKYTFGDCSYCGAKNKALKNGKCLDCKEIDVPDFLKDIFNQGD